MTLRRQVLMTMLFGTLLGACGRGNERPVEDTLPPLIDPGRASVVITDERRIEVLSGLTPIVIALNKVPRSPDKPYHMLIRKEGVASYDIELKYKRDGWYIRGSLVLAESIGGLVIDPSNGVMYTLSVEDVGDIFAEIVAQVSGSLASGTPLVLLSDVPPELLPKMNRVT